MNLVLDGFNSLPFSLSMFREEVVTQDSRMAIICIERSPKEGD